MGINIPGLVQIIEREDHSSSEEVVKNLNTMKKTSGRMSDG